MCCRGSAARHRGPRSPRRRSLRHLRARGRWQRAACRCSGSAFCAPTPAEVRYAVRQRPPDAAKHPVDGSTSCPSRPCRAARQSQTRATQMRHENLKMKTEEKKKRALQSSNLRRQSSTWSILRRCDGRPARCEPGGSETPEVHRANSHSTGRNGQRAPARRRGRKRPARSDGTRSSDARGVARRGADGVVHSYDGCRRPVRSAQKDARTAQRFQG